MARASLALSLVQGAAVHSLCSLAASPPHPFIQNRRLQIGNSTSTVGDTLQDHHPTRAPTTGMSVSKHEHLPRPIPSSSGGTRQDHPRGWAIKPERIAPEDVAGLVHHLRWERTLAHSRAVRLDGAVDVGDLGPTSTRAQAPDGRRRIDQGFASLLRGNTSPGIPGRPSGTPSVARGRLVLIGRPTTTALRV